MKSNIALIAFIILMISSTSYAANQTIPLTNKSLRWLDASWIELVIKDNQNDWLGNWQIAFDHKTNNMQVNKDDHSNGQHHKGKLIVIGGKALLTKGLTLKPGYEIDALDTPVLMTQLLLTLLEQGTTLSPGMLINEQNINHTESFSPIRVSTKSASAFFKAPWSVNGRLKKTDEQDIEFTLEFHTLLGENINYIVSMSGQLNHKPVIKLDDNMPLDGWSVYSLGASTENQFSYGAHPTKTKATTLGQLRETLNIKRAEH